MKNHKKILFLIGVPAITYLCIQTVQARPSIAIKRGIISCTACHYSPAGGGVKNIFGKSVGSHDLGRARFTNQDFISGEVRALMLSALKDSHDSSNGLGLMSGTISSAIPVKQNIDGSEGHLIASYDFAGFGKGAREVFMRWQTTSNGGIKPKHIVIGKFNIPFGQLSDEHRNFLRQQSLTSNNHFEMGAMFSGNVTPGSHYDFAIVQGFQSGGGIPSTGTTWGIVPNFRIMIDSLSTYFGISGLYFKKNGNKKSPQAISIYTSSSFTKKMSMLTEFVLTQNLNDPDIINGYLAKFVDSKASSTYYNELLEKKAFGASIRLDYEITNRFTPFYKIEILAPDKSHLKDSYIKNSLGFRYWFNSNMDCDLTLEKTSIGRDGIKETEVYVSKDKVIASAHIWF